MPTGATDQPAEMDGAFEVSLSGALMTKSMKCVGLIDVGEGVDQVLVHSLPQAKSTGTAA